MRDIRYAIRALLRTPAVTFTALVIMALGIGATTAIFSVANTVLFRPLPFADPERLVQIGTVGSPRIPGVPRTEPVVRVSGFLGNRQQEPSRR